MESALSKEVESLLHCPVTQQPLRAASAAELSALGADFSDGGWITDDNLRAYPNREGFPILVPGEAVTKEG